jgi:ferric-dicitrate binding protein FerR (iron transport regulator)
MNNDNDNFPEDVPFEFIKPQNDECLKERSWNELMENRPAVVSARKRFPGKFWPVLLAAGCLFFLVLLFSKGEFWGSRPIELETIRTGDLQKKFLLPDSSEVFLNKYSVIKADVRHWNDEKREVWLEGEAFFEIRKHRAAGNNFSNFVVHTSRGDIEVLATSFDVMTDSAGFIASLTSGKIRAHIGREETIILSPGQVLQVSHDTMSLKEMNVQLYSAWKEGVFHFDHTGLAEVVDLIKRYYHMKVRVDIHAWTQSGKISGNIGVADSSELIRSLQAVMGLHIRQTGDSLIIHK